MMHSADQRALRRRSECARRRAARHTRLASLGFNGYPDYLRSAEWVRVKFRYRESDQPQDCTICGATENLQLHHLTYERVGGEEWLEDLTFLCKGCHALIHALERRGDINLDFAGLINEERAKRHRAEVEACGDPWEKQREERRQLRAQMPLEWRLGHVRAYARRNHIDISSDLQVIQQRLSKMERKVAQAA